MMNVDQDICCEVAAELQQDWTEILGQVGLELALVALDIWLEWICLDYIRIKLCWAGPDWISWEEGQISLD